MSTEVSVIGPARVARACVAVVAAIAGCAGESASTATPPDPGEYEWVLEGNPHTLTTLTILPEHRWLVEKESIDSTDHREEGIWETRDEALVLLPEKGKSKFDWVAGVNTIREATSARATRVSGDKPEINVMVTFTMESDEESVEVVFRRVGPAGQ